MTLPELIANSPVIGQDAPVAVLSVAVSTTPAAGTVETWTMSQAAQASLQAAAGQWRGQIDGEVVLVDASTTSGTLWSVTRGADGTTPSAHIAGQAIYNKLTAGGLVGLFQSITGPLIGNRQVWFGHSYLAGGGTTHLDRQFVTLLSGMQRTDLVDLGVGGSQAANDNLWTQTTNGGGPQGWGGWAWVLQNVNPSRAGAPYTPGVNYLPCLMTGYNDVNLRSHQATGAPRTIFKTAIRTILARWCASRVIKCAVWSAGTITSASPNITGVNEWGQLAAGMKLIGPGIPTTNTISSFTPAANGTIVMNANATATSVAAMPFFAYDASLAYGGVTWQRPKVDVNKNSGQTYFPIPANGATITFTIPADFEGGAVDLVFIVWPGSDGQITWSGTASALPATTALSGLAYADGTDAATQNTNNRHSSNGHTVRVTGLVASDAGKTIIATYGSGAGTTFSTPAVPVVTPTGGAAGSYTYQRVYRTYNGDTLPAATTIANGPTTLGVSNFNTISAGAAWPSGVEEELIIRSVGGTSQGVIAVLTAGPAAVVDTGLFANAYSATTANPLTGGAAFDSVAIESFNPVTRGVVCNIPTPPAANLTAVGSAATATDFANYNADLAAVVAEFAANQFCWVDVDTALGAATANFKTGDIHPNDRGHAILAETIAAAMVAWAAGLRPRDQAMQSRVMRRITSRAQATRRWVGNLPIGFPTNSSSWPWAAGTDYTLPSSIADVDATNLVLTLDAQVGDDIEFQVSGMMSNVAVAASLDVAICDASGNVMRHLSGAPGISAAAQTVGYPTWYDQGATALLARMTGSAVYTVQPGDLITYNTVPGVLFAKLRGFSTGGTRILYGGGSSGSPPLIFQARNLGTRNTPGFNAS